MKKIYSILTSLIITGSVFTQAPQKMSYQAVIRNNSNALVASTSVGMRISVLQGSITGVVAYSETQSQSTNVNGLISLEIGNGTPIIGSFNTINWANGPYFIKIETDLLGGNNYTIVGTNELLSVPYALFSANGTPGPQGIQGPIGLTGTQGIQGVAGSNGQGVPTGGMANQVLSKVDGTDYNTAWVSSTGQSPGTAAGQMQYWDGTNWLNVSPGKTGQVLTFENGAPVWKTTVGPTDVQNPITGKIWMDRNLGATRIATSVDDASAYGDLYQWGRGKDGHQIRTSLTYSNQSSTDSPGHGKFILVSGYNQTWRYPQNSNLWQGPNGINNPCPTGYRIPTSAELDAERLSWSTQSKDGAFASPLKFTVGGNRADYNGSFVNVDSGGLYWSSTINGAYINYLAFGYSYAELRTANGGFGFSVRCIKE